MEDCLTSAEDYVEWEVEHFRWEVPSLVYSSMERISVGAFVMWLANVATLAICAPLLKQGYPRDLGFRGMFIPLHIISAITSIPIAMTFVYSRYSKKRSSGLLGSVLLFGMAMAQLHYAFQINNNLDLFLDLKNLQNSNDTQVEFITTYYLAMYKDCCLFEDNTTLLDCESKDFESPCFEDKDLFERFREDFEASNQKCVTLTGNDPYGPDSSITEGFCDKNEADFVFILARKVYRRLFALSPVTILFGWFIWWYAAENLFWYTGDKPIY